MKRGLVATKGITQCVNVYTCITGLTSLLLVMDALKSCVVKHTRCNLVRQACYVMRIISHNERLMLNNTPVLILHKINLFPASWKLRKTDTHIHETV